MVAGVVGVAGRMLMKWATLVIMVDDVGLHWAEILHIALLYKFKFKFKNSNFLSMISNIPN